MITVVLGGGLGNQMFQYAFARFIQEKYHDNEMVYSKIRLDTEKNNADGLSQLNLANGVSFISEDEEKKVGRKVEKCINNIRYIKRLFGKNSVLANNYITNLAKRGIFTSNEIYVVQEHSYCLKKNKIVVGGFQTYLYWKDMEKIIRDELKVKVSPSKENAKLIEEMQSCESVCVHVRRGDYLVPQYKHLNVCTENYYYRAMEYVLGEKPDAVFYIFSNNHEEIEWIRKNYDFAKYIVRYVDMENPDYEELRLMYHCKNFIISNSTFSWWGQMLSEAPEKVVVAPSVWNRQMGADGIYMPFWHLIEV